MQVKSTYLNLPVKDLQKARDFWAALGFSFNEAFSDEKALCLILQEEVTYAMLLAHEMFATFTNRAIADGSTTQVLICIQVDSREKVEALVRQALSLGGSKYREAADHGWMYYDSFADPDGHQWEVMYLDDTQMPPSTPQA